ncbi:MAG: peptide-binding protein [Candidatus Omnitrophica bacterium CG1_02_49_10]|nr:MAG: peptide-binding protein [Candidatus Omnitrophica bacterium CG1_02_49_10]
MPLIAAYFLFLTPLSGCGRAVIDYSQDLSPAYGDAIVTGSIGEPINLIPILASDSASGDISGLIFNGLVKYDKDIKLTGDLAESWDITGGGLIITFHLRHGVKWHDGEPFTARDVEFTYHKLIDPDIKTPYGGDFLKVSDFKVVDDYTVRVTYKEAFAPGLASWGMGIMPKHLLDSEDLNGTSFSRNPVGTGPYIFKRWLTADRIELRANPDYFEGRPYVDRYIYRIIPDPTTMFMEMESGGLDYMGLTPLQYSRQTGSEYMISSFNKFRYPSFGYTYMGYNLLNDKFRDVRVRRALNLAVDKNKIIDGVLLGLGRAATGIFPPESWAYDKDVSPAPYDPDAARRMLAGAGWSDSDGDGWLDKDGEVFSFTLVTNQGNMLRKTIAEIVQDNLKNIGIKVEIRVIEWSAFINEFINKKRFDAVILGWSLSRDPDPYDIWHSSKTRKGEFNFISYKNDEVDRLLEEGRRIFDESKRAKIYKKMHRIIYDDQPYVFLYVPDSLPIVHARFKGIVPAPIGIGYDFIRWYVPVEQQKYTR